VDVAHDHDTVHDDGRRRAAEISEIPRNPVVGVVGIAGLEPRRPVGDEVGQQIDDPALGKSRQRHGLSPVLEVSTGLGVERVEKKSRARRENHASAVDLRVGHTFAVVVPHPSLVARRMGLAVGPDRLAGSGVDGDDRAPSAGDGVQQPIDINRRRAEEIIHGRSEVVPSPNPSLLEVFEVRRVDLVEG